MSYPGNPSGEERPNYGYPPVPEAPQQYGPPPQEYAQPVSPAYNPGPPQQPYQPHFQSPEPPPQEYAQPVSPAYGVPDYNQQVSPQPMPGHEHIQGYAAGTAQLPAYSGYGPDQPMSGAPLSSPTAQMQMSAPPMMGPGGYGQPPLYGDAQPAKKRSVAVPILASLLALFVIGTGVFVGLYVDKSGKLDRSQRTVSQQRDTIATRDTDLDKTKKDLQAKTDELTRTEQDLRGTKSGAEETKRERDVIAKCLTLLTQALDAANKGDQATVRAKITEMDQPCAEAERIIGI
jgi:hypothetical protein